MLNGNVNPKRQQMKSTKVIARLKQWYLDNYAVIEVRNWNERFQLIVIVIEIFTDNWNLTVTEIDSE